MSDYICKMCGNYIDTPMHNLGCIVGREENAQQTKPTYEQLESELARLREAIEKAPHELLCNTSTFGKWDTAIKSRECNCWKRDALKEENVG